MRQCANRAALYTVGVAVGSLSSSIKLTLNKKPFMNKTETALLYFPDSTPKVAVRHLMRWIARCAPLLHALEATGYHPCQKSFTCRQLQLVYLHLGEP